MQEFASRQQADTTPDEASSDRVDGNDLVVSENSTFDSNIAMTSSHIPDDDQDGRPAQQTSDNSQPSEQPDMSGDAASN